MGVAIWNTTAGQSILGNCWTEGRARRAVPFSLSLCKHGMGGHGFWIHWFIGTPNKPMDYHVPSFSPQLDNYSWNRMDNGKMMVYPIRSHHFPDKVYPIRSHNFPILSVSILFSGDLWGYHWKILCWWNMMTGWQTSFGLIQHPGNPPINIINK